MNYIKIWSYKAEKFPDWQNDIYRMSYTNFADEHHVVGNSIKLPVELMKKFYILKSFYLSFP